VTDQGGAGRSRLPGTIALVAMFALLVIVAINTLRTPGVSSSGPPAGASLPAFAAPLAASRVEGDVNVATAPGQGAAGARPACERRGPGILTSCELVSDRPAVIAFFAPGRKRCEQALDRLDRASRTVPGVRVAAVALRGDRDAVRRLVAERGWRFPVVHDRDAILANLYGVAVCPQLTYVLRGGTVRETTVGDEDLATLAAQLRALAATAREPA
jgi:hypothetical protein